MPSESLARFTRAFAGGSDEPHETGAGTRGGRGAGASGWLERLLRVITCTGNVQRDHVLVAERIGGGYRDWICFAASPFDAAGDSGRNWNRGSVEPARDSASGNGAVLGHHDSGHASWIDRGLRDAAIWKNCRLGGSNALTFEFRVVEL